MIFNTGLGTSSFILGYLLFGALSFIILTYARAGWRGLITGRSVTIMTVLFWYGIEMAFPGEMVSLYPQSAYNFSVFVVALSVGCFLVSYRLSRGKLFEYIRLPLAVLEKPNTRFRIFAIGLVIGILPLVIVSGGDISEVVLSPFRLGARWSGAFQRARYGGLSDAILELQMFLKAVIPLAVMIVTDKQQSTSRRAGAGFFLVWSFFQALSTWTRTSLLPVMLPIAAFGFWKIPERHRTLTLLVGLPTTLVLGLIWSAISVESRESGRIKSLNELSGDYVGYEMFQELMFLTQFVPQNIDYVYGRTYFTQLVNPIPRFLWPSKPRSDAGLLLAEMRGEVNPNTGEAYLTRSPGVIGEMYWNFGILGVVFISFFYGALVKGWDELFLKYGVLSFPQFCIFCSGLALIFVSGRSFTMSLYYGMISFFVLIMFIGRSKQRF